jgi:isoleucyl-tRNA synthetase
LRLEGLARELARALNDLRKRRGLALSDRVSVTIEAGLRMAAAVDAHRAWIMAQVLADELGVGQAGSTAEDLDIEGETVRVALAVSRPAGG